ncbi:MAG: penicillin-binding transpeptidase domain-containing protein [Verrucomicrobiota bacterium]
MNRWLPLCYSLLILAGFSTVTAEEKDFLILESYTDKGVPKLVDGDPKLARLECSPASTFKVVIAWAGLETGAATLDTKIEVGDRHVPNTPREINLRQALYYSSNDFFISLAQKIGKEKLTEYVQKSGMFRGEIPEDWLGDEWRPVIKGGNLDTTPMQNHLFMRKVAFRSLTENKQVSKDLISALTWPTNHPMVQLYGKTGVWGGAVWFNGFGVKQRHRRVRTVFMQGTIERRVPAIMSFYRGWEVRWSSALNQKMEE